MKNLSNLCYLFDISATYARRTINETLNQEMNHELSDVSIAGAFNNAGNFIFESIIKFEKKNHNLLKDNRRSWRCQKKLKK